MSEMQAPAQKTRIDCPCVIIAGGSSQRFGADKASASLDGVTLLDHATARIRSQVVGEIAVNVSRSSDHSAGPLECVNDLVDQNVGPLAGLHAALVWAQTHQYPLVLTIPVDTPFFPTDLAYQLQNAGAPAIAMAGGRVHPMFGIWSASLCDELEAAIARGVRRMHEWVDICSANRVDFETRHDVDPFFNINTRMDLSEAHRYLARQSRKLE